LIGTVNKGAGSRNFNVEIGIQVFSRNKRHKVAVFSLEFLRSPITHPPKNTPVPPAFVQHNIHLPRFSNALHVANIRSPGNSVCWKAVKSIPTCIARTVNFFYESDR